MTVTTDQVGNLGAYRAGFARSLLDIVRRHYPPLHVLQHAACQGVPVEQFFADRTTTIKPWAAEVCGRCPVRVECRDWARRQDSAMDGVFGGESPSARRQAIRDANRRC